MAGGKLLAFWLVPAEPEREFFVSIIRVLAEQLQAPVFEPHVTVFATAATAIAPADLVMKINAEPIRLSIAGIGHSGQFIRTLFVRFDPEPTLQKLNARLREVSGGATYKLHAHLSLMYKQLPVAIREDLASGIRVPFHEVNFDLLRVVACPSPVDSSAAVDAFEVLETMQLG